MTYTTRLGLTLLSSALLLTSASVFANASDPWVNKWSTYVSANNFGHPPVLTTLQITADPSDPQSYSITLTPPKPELPPKPFLCSKASALELICPTFPNPLYNKIVMKSPNTIGLMSDIPGLDKFMLSFYLRTDLKKPALLGNTWTNTTPNPFPVCQLTMPSVAYDDVVVVLVTPDDLKNPTAVFTTGLFELDHPLHPAKLTFISGTPDTRPGTAPFPDTTILNIDKKDGKLTIEGGFTVCGENTLNLVSGN